MSIKAMLETIVVYLWRGVWCLDPIHLLAIYSAVEGNVGAVGVSGIHHLHHNTAARLQPQPNLPPNHYSSYRFPDMNILSH